MSTNVHVVRAGDGRRLTVPDADITVLVGDGRAGGAYEVFLVEAPRGAPGRRHAEPWSKSYHVLRGRILVQAGDTGYELEPGETIVIEARTMNTFTVLSEAAGFLLVVAGTANSGFFAELDATGHGHAPEEAARLLREVADSYGVALATGAGAP